MRAPSPRCGVMKRPLWAVISGRPRLPLFSACGDPVRIKPDRKRPRWRAPCHSPTSSPCHSGWTKASTWHRSNTVDPRSSSPSALCATSQGRPAAANETNYAARRPGSPWKTNGSGRAKDHAIGRGALADHARSPDIHAMPKGHITGDQTVWKDGNQGIFPTLAAPFAAEGADMADAAPALTDDALTRPRPDTFRPDGL